MAKDDRCSSWSGSRLVRREELLVDSSLDLHHFHPGHTGWTDNLRKRHTKVVSWFPSPPIPIWLLTQSRNSGGATRSLLWKEEVEEGSLCHTKCLHHCRTRFLQHASSLAWSCWCKVKAEIIEKSSAKWKKQTPILISPWLCPLWEFEFCDMRSCPLYILLCLLHPLEHLHTTDAQSLFFRWMNLWMNEQLWILVSKYCFVYNYRKNGYIAQRCPLKTNLFEQQFNYIKSNCPLLYYRPNPIPTEISICILKAWLQLPLSDFPVDSFLMAEK